MSPAAIFPAVPLPLDRLFHAILHLPADRLQGLVDLLFHFLLRQSERLLHLLAHRVRDLPLQVAENRLNGLADLVLQHLAQGLSVTPVGLLTAVVLIASLIVPLASRLPGPAIVLVLSTRTPLLFVGVRLPAPPRCPLVFVGSLCPSRLFDGHNNSLLRLA